jgi:hypothetical protein
VVRREQRLVGGVLGKLGAAYPSAASQHGANSDSELVVVEAIAMNPPHPRGDVMHQLMS